MSVSKDTAKKFLNFILAFYKYFCSWSSYTNLVLFWFLISPGNLWYIWIRFSDFCLQKRLCCNSYQWCTFWNGQSAKKVSQNLPKLKLLYLYKEMQMLYIQGLHTRGVLRVRPAGIFHHLILCGHYVRKAKPTEQLIEDIIGDFLISA